MHTHGTKCPIFFKLSNHHTTETAENSSIINLKEYFLTQIYFYLMTCFLFLVARRRRRCWRVSHSFLFRAQMMKVPCESRVRKIKKNTHKTQQQNLESKNLNLQLQMTFSSNIFLNAREWAMVMKYALLLLRHTHFLFDSLHLSKVIYHFLFLLSSK